VFTASSDAIARSRDKLHSLQVMVQAGLPSRAAVVARPRRCSPRSAVEAAGGGQLIRGTQGRGVLLAHHLATISAIFAAGGGLNQQAVIQRYARPPGAICGSLSSAWPVAAMEPARRRAASRQPASRVAPVTLTGRQRRWLWPPPAPGLAVAGVDLLLSQRGPLLLEVNSSPGLEDRGYRVAVAEAIVEYVEANARRRR
jgi:ribosomal protein S6--L-glutamate ligase